MYTIKLFMNIYLLFKTLHLIAIVSWMAGLLYLPRIFVYHVENIEKKESIEIFKVMEKKLYFYIMYPAMVLSWIFGFNTDFYNRLFQFEFFMVKIETFICSFINNLSFLSWEMS